MIQYYKEILGNWSGSKTKQIKSKEEQYCEEHFLRTHTRRKDGRYVVEMAIKTDGLACLGESREIQINN